MAGMNPETTSQLRVRPRHCDAQAMVHAARYYEFFEDAYLDWLDEHIGGYAALRALGVDLVIVANGCEYRSSARLDDVLDVVTQPTAVGTSSVTMSFTITRGAEVVAIGRATYVCVAGGKATPLRGRLAEVLAPNP